MTMTPNPAQALSQRTSAKIINGPWPTYIQFKGFPERERWTIYELAKAGRMKKEDQGIVSSETYDAFVPRITEELEL
ncbi:hypothetical protein [Pseudomonas shirazica]|uniref:hypothetical protein n=1 Tax=Pseudomonas shirazica TaxID=1940636 RepID=UPI003AAC0A66